jgi:hypothetical protein
MEFVYKPKTQQQLKRWFNARQKKGVIGFKDFNHFKKWYDSQKKECKYCGLSEEESQVIVMTPPQHPHLTSNRFPQNGIITRGHSRGVWLEIDRVNPKGNYSENNCVLCCYFCNNDKSDVFDGQSYPKFMSNRKNYLISLISKF